LQYLLRGWTSRHFSILQLHCHVHVVDYFHGRHGSVGDVEKGFAGVLIHHGCKLHRRLAAQGFGLEINSPDNIWRIGISDLAGAGAPSFTFGLRVTGSPP
jgi:hypothetical protein